MTRLQPADTPRVPASRRRLPVELQQQAPAGRQLMPVELQQMVSYAFATPPPDVPAKRAFDTPEWEPRTYMPLKTVWCED